MDDRMVTTGLAGLDTILSGLRMGDNVVWRVDDIDDYRALVAPFAAAARVEGRRVVYLRFGRHAPLLDPGEVAVVHDLDAYRGFESFTVRLHTILADEGPGVFYVFDCLSDLLDAWATDAMIAHFFLVTCPYLYDLDTVAYFALLRPSHSTATVARIRSTTQVLVEVPPVRRRALRAPGEGRRPLLADHVPAPPAHRGGVRPADQQLDATTLFTRLHSLQRGPGGSPARPLGPAVHPGRVLAASSPADDRRPAMVEQLGRVLIGREDRMLALGPRALRPRRPGRDAVPADRDRVHRRQGRRHAAGPQDPGEPARPRLGRRAGAPRLLVRRLGPLLLLHRHQRVVAAIHGAADQRRVLHGRRAAAHEPAGRSIPARGDRGVPGDARALRPVPDHRALQQPAGGRVRQRVRRQVRQRLPASTRAPPSSAWRSSSTRSAGCTPVP